mgnify:FL=1
MGEKTSGKQVRYIMNIDHLMKVWELERDRFELLYNYIPREGLNDVVKTSPLRRRVGEYMPCMLIWLEAGLEYFDGKIGDWEEQDVTTFTNNKLRVYETVPCAVVWGRLREVDRALRKKLKRIGETEVFSDPCAWSWAIWCGPGHYEEHSSQLEAHFAGKTSKPEEVVWCNQYTKK